MKLRTKAFLVFFGTVAALVGSLLVFIQSKPFAALLRDIAQKYMPVDLHVKGDFSELAVKLVPPGVVIKNPSVTFEERNIVGLPAGTKIDAQFIDITFQFFQLLTGSVNINAFAIHGATVKLDLNEKFFQAQEKNQQVKSRLTGLLPKKFSWETLLRFNFRSISLIDSQLDVRLSPKGRESVIRAQFYAKEFTVGRSTVDSLPAYDIAMDVQNAYVELPEFKHALSQLQASVEVSSRGIAIRNLGLQENELNLHVNGKVAGNVLNPSSLKSDLAYILRGPLPAWLSPDLGGRYIKKPKGVPLEGTLTIEGTLVADLMDFENTIETKARLELENARFGEWHASQVLLKGMWKTPVLSLDSAELKVGDGTVRLTDTVYDLSKGTQSLRLKATLENTDFRRLMGSLVDSVYPLHMRLSGSIDANVSIGKELNVDGRTNLTVTDFSFDNQKPDHKKPLIVLFAIPKIDLAGKFKIDKEAFKFYETEAKLPHSHLKAFGTIDPKDGFNIDVSGPIDLADIGKLGQFDIRGVGDLHWTIRGKKPEVLFAFDANLKGSQYLNLHLGNVKGRLVYNDGKDLLSFHDLSGAQGRTQFIANGTIDVGAKETADMDIRVPSGTISDFAAVFSNFIRDAVPWYPQDLTGKLSGAIKVSGKTDMNLLSVEGDMELTNVDFKREIFRHGKLRAGYRRGAYVAENINFQKKLGWIRGSVVYGADDVLSFDLKSDRLSTLDIDHLASFGIPYRAPLEIIARGTGKLGDLDGSLSVNFGDGVIKNFSVARTSVSMVSDQGRVQGEMSVFGGQLKGRVNLGWAPGAQSSIDIDAGGFDFQPVLVGLNPELSEDPELMSNVSGSAHLRFQTGELSKLSGTVNLETYLLRKRGYSLMLSKPLKLDIVKGNYEFDDLLFSGEGTLFKARGKVRDGNINYSMGGTINLSIFEFLVHEIASIRGSANVDAEIRGKADSPHVKAAIEMKDADVRIRSIEQPFEDLKFSAIWSDSSLKVSSFAAKFAGGAVRGSGAAELYLSKVPDLDFQMELDNPKVKVYPVTYARTSGNLTLKGKELPYSVKGSVSVAEALIRENFSLSEGSRVLKSSKFLPQKSSGSGEIQIFDLDVNLDADRGILVRNDLFDAELKGNIRVINSVQTPRLLGNVDILHGKLLFKDNFFAIQSGDLRFTNPSVIDPAFNLIGQTDIKGYKVILVASGNVSDYKLTFQSQPPLSQNDIVNLLTLGITSSDFQNIARENRSAYSRDEMYSLVFSQTQINKGIQEKLGVKVRVDQSQAVVPENVFRARSNADSPETISPKVVVQKQITKKLNAAVGSTVGVGGNQEKNIDLEYDIARKWSILGTYEDQRGAQLKQQRTSIGADLKFKLRFK
ncbi:MAG: translocation/assembly module TamB domain-containing protein [Bdellovibrionota bacterium]